MANSNNDHGVNIIFLLIAGLILLIGFICASIYVDTTMPSSRDYEAISSGQISAGIGDLVRQGRRIRVTPTPVEASAEDAGAEAAVDLDEVIAAINKGGCIACHIIPNIPGAVGQVGPDLSNIGVEGAARREGYSAEEYIRESLQDPLAFTAPECPIGPCVTGTMPPLQLEDAEIETIVNYLSTLDTDE